MSDIKNIDWKTFFGLCLFAFIILSLFSGGYYIADKIKGRDFLPSAKDTITALAAIQVGDSIATVQDTTQLKSLTMGEGYTAYLRELGAGGYGGGEFIGTDVAYKDTLDWKHWSIFEHPTSGLNWVRTNEFNRTAENVIKYGAIPNDGLSDSVAFAQALATTRHVYVPRGEFNVGKMYMSYYGQRLEGAGPLSTNLVPLPGTDTLIIVSERQTTIANIGIHGQKYDNIDVCIAYWTDGTGSNPGGTSSTLDNMLIWYFQSTSDTSIAVYLGGGNSITISDCIITRNDINIKTGLNIINANVEIHDCRLGRARYYGIWFLGPGGRTEHTINIIGCTFEQFNYKAEEGFNNYSIPIYLNMPSRQFRLIHTYAELDTSGPLLKVDSDMYEANIDGGYINGYSINDNFIQFADNITVTAAIRNMYLPAFNAPGGDVDSSSYAIGGLDNSNVKVNIYDSQIRQTSVPPGTTVADTINTLIEARPRWYTPEINVGNHATSLMQPTYTARVNAPYGTNVINQFGVIESTGQYWRKSGIGRPRDMNHVVHFYLDSLYLGPQGSWADTLHYVFWYPDSTQNFDPFDMDLKITFVHTVKDSNQWAAYEVKAGAYKHGYISSTDTMSYMSVTELVHSFSSDSLHAPPTATQIFHKNAGRYIGYEWLIIANPLCTSGSFWVWVEGTCTGMKYITHSRAW